LGKIKVFWLWEYGTVNQYQLHNGKKMVDIKQFSCCCQPVNLIYFILVVSKLSQSGEEELLTMKQKVQILADETAHSLKKNVYKNYSQFIETAKEISSKSNLSQFKINKGHTVRNGKERILSSSLFMILIQLM
jgi:hypothetical protein